MDIILYFLYLVFGVITISPFIYIYNKDLIIFKKIENKESEESLSLREKRRLYMDNLKDLKMEFDTGKLTDLEFRELSEGIVMELRQVDDKILELQSLNQSMSKCQCGYVITLVDAKFCPSCGKKI